MKEKFKQLKEFNWQLFFFTMCFGLNTCKYSSFNRKTRVKA